MKLLERAAQLLERAAQVALTFVALNYAAVVGFFAALRGRRVWR